MQQKEEKKRVSDLAKSKVRQAKMTSAFMQRKFGDRVVAIPSPIASPRDARTPMKYD